MPLLNVLSEPSSSSDPKPSPGSAKKNSSGHRKRDEHPRLGHHYQQPKQHQHRQAQPPPPSPSPPVSSWNQFKNFLSCKHLETVTKVHDPSRSGAGGSTYTVLGSSCSSICNFKDVVHGNTRVVHRSDNSPEGSTVGQEVGLLKKKKGGHPGSSLGRSSASLAASRSKAAGGSSRGMQFRKLSGCYECHMIVDPSRHPYTPRSTICACSQCGEVFPKMESLELHQTVQHAVSELGPEDSGRNIVEIIFKSSWMKKDNPICRIERILRVHNTQRTIQRFEECRDTVKTRALAGPRRNPRCAADGNELLRFHCASLACSLGSRGSSSLCGSVPGCGVCTIIRHGFQGKSAGQGHGHGEASSHQKGVRTTASSGRAHDLLRCTNGRRAMLVCRVIAGKVRQAADEVSTADEDVTSSPAVGAMSSYYDSMAGSAGTYASLEDLYVFNPKAILPCFVVIYRAMDC
ncbi:hypothetical protein MLD38_034378 [Melastoma candidum]|uniref:Uncharacterized protein n=1 Tax=Melastoma candidum TaxID=119954 RepID=A0ACB9MAB4_9MYRT|nr:hypothetical protein MLD38_034378 [Melastoma candidum]